MVAYGKGIRIIKEETIKLAISDTEDAQLYIKRWAWWHRTVASFAAAAIIASVSGYVGFVS